MILQNRPQKRIEKGMKETRSIFSLPIEFTSKVIRSMQYKKVYDTDQFALIPLDPMFAPTKDDGQTIAIRIETDYAERITTLSYHGFSGLFSKLGGYHASLNAIWKYILPFFIMYFLYSLAIYIKLFNKELYQD